MAQSMELKGCVKSRVTSCARQGKETTGPLRSRKINAAVDNRNFQPPRPNMNFDNVKLKQISEAKVRTQEVKIPNTESFAPQTKTLVQKNKILNKEPNHQALNIVAKQELKRVTENFPGRINKVAGQKKTLLATPKTKMSVANVEEITSPMNTNKVTKAPNVINQKTKPQEKAVVVQKAKLESDITVVKNKALENDTITVKAQSDSAAVPVTQCQKNTPITKPTPEVNQDNKSATSEKKPENIQDPAKITPASPVEKPKMEPSKTKDVSAEKCELDPLLACAVEEELKDLMIQVWQELPDEPSEEEDRLAVDKLRNEAGDDLRRVLGLNITKRLLNVYNNLFLKMEFTCRPQMGCLTSFLKEYHIGKFKRIDKNSNVFAAELETIEDYDRLCTTKEIKCGEAKVTITPCYKFTQCPKNLKTLYDDTYFYEDTGQEHSESSKSKNNTQKNKVTASKKNAVKPAVKVENINAKSTNKPDKVEIHTANPACVDTKRVQNDSENISVQSTNTSTNATSTDTRTDINKITNSVHTESKETKKDSTIIEKNSTEAPKIIITKDTKSKDKEVTGSVTVKKQINTYLTKEKIIGKYDLKDKLLNGDDDSQSEVPENQMEGEDELDDEDILALMSEGVVLDECSGSEDEN